MQMSEKLMLELTQAVDLVLKKHKGVIDSYLFRFALVSPTIDLTLRLRDMTDDELSRKEGK